MIIILLFWEFFKIWAPVTDMTKYFLSKRTDKWVAKNV